MLFRIVSGRSWGILLVPIDQISYRGVTGFRLELFGDFPLAVENGLDDPLCASLSRRYYGRSQ
jgi:hypothetical protein